MTDIAARLAQVRARIREACARSGRDPEDVRLVAVSKFHSAEAIRAAYAVGQRAFGENYAQELAEKATQLTDLPELRFHFIGALQRNKAKLLVPHAHVVETVASEAAARALAARAKAEGTRLPIFVQVNVSGEPQKSGMAPENVQRFVDTLHSLDALEVRGLMTIPAADDLEGARAAYRRLRELAQACGLAELSMGMSDDLEVAIEEGSTNVRVGTAIFGPRPG